MNIRFTTLDECMHLREECIHLIERAFEYAIEHKFDVDFLPLMQTSNAKNNHIILDEDSGRVIAHIGVCLRELGNQSFSAACALIGGIAVEEEFRGKGLFAKLMEHIITYYNDNVALFILWSDKATMYEKFDFIQAGGIVETSSTSELPDSVLSSYIKTSVKDLPGSQLRQIKEIYSNVTSKNNTTFLRTDGHWEAIEQMTSTDLYIKVEDDLVISYFFINKGFDLQGVIHEVGYLNEAKFEVIEELSQARLWLSESELDICPQNHLIFAALFRPGNKKLFSELIRNWSSGELEVESITDDEVEFVYQGSKFKEPYQNFLPGLFGPGPIEEFENYGPPLYLSGLDSI